jgi:hypothetical protein
MTHLMQTASITGLAVFLLAATAMADTTYTTTAGSGFNGTGGLTLTSTGGDVASLVFTPETNTTAVPNNIDFGTFSFSCVACTSLADGSGATFAPFYFDLVVDEGGAIGTFVGQSTTDQTIYTNSSTLKIDWLPLQLGPGASGADSGNFGPLYFTIDTPTDVRAPGSGNTVVTGQVLSDPAPEPPTIFSLLGGTSLVLVGLARRKKRAQR